MHSNSSARFTETLVVSIQHWIISMCLPTKKTELGYYSLSTNFNTRHAKQKLQGSLIPLCLRRKVGRLSSSMARDKHGFLFHNILS